MAYQIVSWGNGVSSIEEGIVRMYLIQGDARAMLLDTGLGSGDLPEAVRSVWKGPLDVLNTHGHEDHVGGNSQFLKICAHPGDWPMDDAEYFRMRPIQEGDCFDLGGRILRSSETQAIRPAALHYWIGKIAFCSAEITLRTNRCFYVWKGASLTEYLKSLHKLLDLSRAYDVIYACHGTAGMGVEQVRKQISCCEAILAGAIVGEAS